MTHPPTRHYLTTHSPSPTTVSYTVSTRSPNPNTKTKFINISKHLLRIILVTVVLLINLTKSQSHLHHHWPQLQSIISTNHLPRPLASLLESTATSYTWPTIAVVSLLVACLCLRRDYTEETLLTLSNLGLQTTSTSPWFLPSATSNTSSTNFIPTTQILDIVIHEAFQGLEVRFYLAIIVKGRGEVVVVFPKLLPKLEILEEVYRGARKCLYESGS